MFAHFVNALPWAIRETRHGGGIDNVALGALLEHARDKEVDAMDHAPQIDAQHPFPVCQGAFPGALPASDPALLHNRCTAE